MRRLWRRTVIPALMNDAERQKRFHLRADAPRLRNRLENPWILSRERRLAERLAAFCPRRGKVLEVGCGEGTNLVYLREERPDARYIGLDFSAAKISFASKSLPGPAYLCGDAQLLPFPSECFDFVFCRDLLHHVDFNRDGVVAEMLRVLVPGGTVAILEAQGATLLNRLFQLLYPAERGLANSSPESLLRLGAGCSKASLDFVEASFVVRALGFVLAWEGDSRWRLPRNICYFAGNALESILERLVPRRNWPMMLACFTKAEDLDTMKQP
jgi:SAM-dependent methyltransferase